MSGVREVIARLDVAGRTVAELNDGSDIVDFSSPRPYLHPIRTLAGVCVSDSHPADHDWQCGLNMAMPWVNGINFWGGNTYVHGRGYVPLADHGRIDVDAVHQHDASTWRARLVWRGPLEDDPSAPAPVELVEERTMTWQQVDECTWRLDATIELASEQGDVRLGSPGTNGRDVGYGGWQLRLASNAVRRVWSDQGDGEAEVFGRPAGWLAYSADFDGGTATVVLVGRETGPDDVWFVRTDNPGLGSALAWSQTIGLPQRRRYTLFVADGELTDAEVARLV